MNDTTTAHAHFLDRLRSQTQTAHQKLESLPVSRAIVSPHLDRATYSQYLQLMADVVWDFETHYFQRLESTIPNLRQRAKLPWLYADLAALGTTAKAPMVVFDRSEAGIAFAMGMFYTVEGSTLGGRYILKNVGDLLQLDETNGAAYFYGYGNQSGAMWKAFINILQDLVQNEADAVEVIAGAQYAFDAIYQHFEQFSA